MAGTAQSGTLLSWKLEYRLDGEATYTRFATGSTSVVDSTLGTLDPTMLLNGIYEIRLTATDTSGRLQRASQKVVVRDNQKVGPFSLSFVDLEVPVAGLPMRVTRTYDSRDKGKGDFGFGWRLGLSNVRLNEKEIAGLAWKGIVQPGFFPTYCLQATSSQVVTVTMTGRQGPGVRARHFAVMPAVPADRWGNGELPALAGHQRQPRARRRRVRLRDRKLARRDGAVRRQYV